MKFDINSFELQLTQYKDGHLEFVLYGHYISDLPLDGMYQRSCYRLLGSEYSCYDNDYSRIMNLCTPTRFASASPCSGLFDISLSGEPIALFTLTYRFLYADCIKSMKKALDFYGVIYDYESLLAELLF